MHISKGIRTAVYIGTLLFGEAVAQDGVLLSYPDDSLKVLYEKPYARMVETELGSISSAWFTIEDAFTKSGVPSTDFELAMEHNKALLNEAASSSDPIIATEIVHDVHADLAVKASYVKATEQFTGSAYSQVAVTVRTRKHGKEVHGYHISFSPRRYRYGSPMFPFNNPTSPSTGGLPPGNYEMIATFNGTIVQRQEVAVGTDGGREAAITCVIF